VEHREDGENAVLLRPNRRGQSFRDLELEHQGRVGNRRALAGGAEQHEQNRRRDVVGQVARDADRALGNQIREIDPQHIGSDDAGIARKPRAKPLREVSIDFDGRELRDARREPKRQRAGPGADLDEPIGWSRRNRVEDLVGPRRLEEVLREPLPYDCSIDSPRQNFSSISSISSSLMPK
jgi:hypothetical protein